MEKTNLKLAQDYASILKAERGVNKKDFVAFYSALVTAYSTLAIAEKMYEEKWTNAEILAIVEERLKEEHEEANAT